MISEHEQSHLIFELESATIIFNSFLGHSCFIHENNKAALTAFANELVSQTSTFLIRYIHAYIAEATRTRFINDRVMVKELLPNDIRREFTSLNRGIFTFVIIGQSRFDFV